MYADDLSPPPPSGGSKTPLIVLGSLLGLSLLGNLALVMRGPREVVRTVAAPASPPPPAQQCPEQLPCPTCPTCPACPTPTVASNTGGGTGTVRPPRPPPVDHDAAAEGEAHVAHAERVAERDPVQVAAQRRVADGVDRIVASRSPAAAERFMQRNLPSLASMECAFRDPASAEHVRLRLRELNAIARPNARLSDADLARYERELRCPRE